MRNRSVPRLLAIPLICFLGSGSLGFRHLDSPLASTKEFTLANGLKILFLEQREAPLVAIDLWIRAGSRSELANEGGAAHFIEHMIFKGTPTRAAGEIDAAFEDIGSSLNAGTTRGGVHFYATIAPSYLAESLDVLADSVSSPTLRQEDLERERAVILDESARTRNDWKRLARESAWISVFGHAAFARPVLGNPLDFAALSREALDRFHQRTYLPNNSALIVVGAVTPEAARDAATAAFSPWKSQPIPEVTVGGNSVSTAKEITRESAGPESAACLAAALPPKLAVSQLRAAEILAVILGDAREGRLATALKRAHKGAESAAELGESGGPSVLLLCARSAGASASSLLKTLDTEVEKLHVEGINEGEAEWARRKLLGKFLFDAETYGGMARLLGEGFSLGDHKRATTYMDSVRELTAVQINEVARKYLAKEHRTSIELKPK